MKKLCESLFAKNNNKHKMKTQNQLNQSDSRFLKKTRLDQALVPNSTGRTNQSGSIFKTKISMSIKARTIRYFANHIGDVILKQTRF